MKRQSSRIVTIYSDAYLGSPGQAVLLVMNSRGNVLAETHHALVSPPGTGLRGARLSSVLSALETGHKYGASHVKIYTADPYLASALNKQAPIELDLAGIYLQARAMAHMYRSAQIGWAPYPAMSDLPVIASGG